MDTIITLPEELGRRIAAAAEAQHRAIEALAIDALEHFLDVLEEDTRTRHAIARFRSGEIRVVPGDQVFARYLAEGLFTEEDLAEARAEVCRDAEPDVTSSAIE